jgi:hypothetical protein
LQRHHSSAISGNLTAKLLWGQTRTPYPRTRPESVVARMELMIYSFLVLISTKKSLIENWNLEFLLDNLSLPLTVIPS